MVFTIRSRTNVHWPPSLLTTIILLVCYTSLTAAQSSSVPRSETKDGRALKKNDSSIRYKSVTVDFQNVAVPYVICLWILLASFAKIGFHLYDKLPHYFPESCLLIILGLIVGFTLYYTETASIQQYTLDANSFFLFLLPPIVFDAGYNIPNRPLFNNIGTVLTFAVVNTLWNTFGIGAALYAASYIGWIDREIGLFSCCVFGALISAVDPVAVLAIFEEIQINEILYIIVFGESLLNDGVTVVMYRMMVGFTNIGDSNVQLVDYASGLAQFLLVIFGGSLIGLVFGVIGVIITKYTDHVRILEPLFIFVIGYLGYLTSEIVGLSSILALTFSGIVLKHYTEANMAKKSTTTVKYFLKMMATIMETIIFMFLGLSTIIDNHDFQLDFILYSIFFCLLFRITGVLILAAFLNRYRLIRMSLIDQFIMSYGGLRGGVAFCLALLLSKDVVPERELYVTTTTVIIYFTNFIQGVTIKPVVNALKVERAGEKESTMNEIIHRRFIDHLMAGVEDIIGKSGQNSFYHKFDYYNTKYVKPFLLREKPRNRDTSIVATFTKLSVQEAKAAVLGGKRDSAFSLLTSYSQPMANLFSRRATIAVPGDRDHTAVVNLHSSDPSLTNILALRDTLRDSMSERTNAWTRARHHSLTEFTHLQSLRHSGDFKHQNSHINSMELSDLKKRYTPGDDNDDADDNLGDVSERKMRKIVSFSSQSNLSTVSDQPDATDTQENASYRREDSLVSSPVVFNLGMPVPLVGANKVTKSAAMTPAPKSVSESSNADLAKEAMKFSLLSSQNSVPSTSFTSGKNVSNVATNNPAPLDNGNVQSTHDASVFHSDSKCEEDSSSDVFSCELNTVKTDNLDEENEFPCNTETLAETSLPWRRQTSLPPVPSSVTVSLPDDENPLMSEAPSWADNLAYSHLTETGSPYTSPQTTIVGRPQEAAHRPVFELFPTSSPQLSESVVSSIPPPWSCKDNKVGDNDDEPLPSHSLTCSEAGDKASCLLMSSHDHVPPLHHSCLEAAVNGLDSSTFRRHSDVGSPIHFQLMQKPDTVSEAAIESHLIGIEEDYLYGMADRVSQWLANSSSSGLTDVDTELSNKEEGWRILESLRNKQKLIMDDTDDGTDADVESDNEVFATKL